MNNTLFNGTLAKVIDGDTVSVVIELPLNVSKLETIRLLDIDAPERNTPKGKASTVYLIDLLTNKSIVVDIGSTINGKRDKYGRLLAHIYTVIGDKRTSISTALLEAGFAAPYEPK